MVVSEIRMINEIASKDDRIRTFQIKTGHIFIVKEPKSVAFKIM